jgi:hypothetical protein
MPNKGAEQPLYTTAYGGEATQRGGDVVFIKEPNVAGYVMGCRVPIDWDLVPLNEPATKKTANRDNQYPWSMC